MPAATPEQRVTFERGRAVAMRRFTAADLELPVDFYDPTIYHDTAQKRLFGFDRDENTEWEKSWRP